jgi:hypothetical protein
VRQLKRDLKRIVVPEIGPISPIGPIRGRLTAPNTTIPLTRRDYLIQPIKERPTLGGVNGIPWDSNGSFVPNGDTGHPAFKCAKTLRNHALALDNHAGGSERRGLCANGVVHLGFFRCLKT